MMTVAEFVDHATKIASIASTVAMAHFRNQLNVEFKSDDSPVTQADKAVEMAVREYISDHFPDHGILGEEHGVEGIDNTYLWITDPIDGTRSFLSGHPLFGFLLALLKDGQPLLGVVGMPALGEVYLGVKGSGATLNGDPVSVTNTKALSQAVLFVNEGDKISEHYPTVFKRLMQAGQTRRFAYDCYPHALLAAGFVDAVIDCDLKPYDYLPVSTIIEAAGGIITDWFGDPLTLQSDGRIISAATRELHRELLLLVNV